MIAAISIGNSRINAALVEGEAVTFRCSVKVEQPNRWRPFLKDLAERAGRGPWIAASVNPPCLEAFEALCPAPLIVLGRDAPIPMANRTLEPERTGSDRLLTGYAAARIHGAPLLVVDFGTAYTFNRIDGDGAFLGGAILPGLRVAAEGLAGCSLLPRLDLDLEPVPLLGRDTDSAIRSGLLNGYLGMVESMVRRFVAATDPPCPAAATGGDAPFFVSNSASFSIHDPDLLVKGIAMAHAASTSG